MKKITKLLTIGFLVLGCSNDDAVPNQVVGNWKLVEAKMYGLEGGSSSEASIDYSGKDIRFSFKSNGTLVVSGGSNVGFSNGEYKYVFGKDTMGWGDEQKYLVVNVDGAKWFFSLVKDQMTLSRSYVDGPDLIFKRYK